MAWRVSTINVVPTDLQVHSPAISLLWIITFGEMLLWSFLTNSQGTGGTLSFVVSNDNNSLTFGHACLDIHRFMPCPHPKSPLLHPRWKNTNLGSLQTLSHCSLSTVSGRTRLSGPRMARFIANFAAERSFWTCVRTNLGHIQRENPSLSKSTNALHIY